VIKNTLIQARKNEERKTHKRILKWVLVILAVLYFAVNLTCAFPIFGWHPHACLCDVCLTQYDDERR